MRFDRAPMFTAFTSVLACACASEPAAPLSVQTLAEIDLKPLLRAGAVPHGIARDPATGNLAVIVERQGILSIDEDGALVDEKPIGRSGLEDRPFRDIALVGDGRILLIADNEGYLWDEETGRFAVHFCVEPGEWESCTDETGALIDTNENEVCDLDECVVDGALVDINLNGECDWGECIDATGNLIDVNHTGVCDWEECIDPFGELYDSNADGICDSDQCWDADGNVTPRGPDGCEPVLPPEPEPEPQPAQESATSQSDPPLAAASDGKAKSPRDGTSRIDWASLLKRIFKFDVLACGKCGGRMKVLAVIEDPPVIEKLLSHMGLPHVPLPTSPARGQRVFDFFAA